MRKALLITIFLCLILKIQANSINLKDRVVITADRVESKWIDANRSTDIISSKDIEDSGAKNILDIFSISSGVNVGDITSSGKSGVVDVRGQGEAAKNNVVYLINGIRQNSIDMSGPDLSNIDLFNVDRIEILKGSNSVLYGDKALGGVINIITKNRYAPKAISTLKTELSSYNTFRTNYSIDYSKMRNSFGLAIGMKNSNGYRDNSDVKEQNVKFNYNYMINPNQDISFNYKKFKDDYGLPGNLTESEFQDDATKALYNDYSTFPAVRKDNKDSVKTNSDVYSLIHTFNSKSYKVISSFSKSSKTDTTNMMSWSQGEKEINKSHNYFNSIFTKEFKKNSIKVGIDVQKSSIEKDSNDIDKDSKALFITNSYKINSKYDLSFGIRKEIIDFKFYTGKEKSYNENLFDLGLSYKVSSMENLFVRYSDGFRAPAVDEYFEVGNPAFGTSDHYNVDLKLQKNSELEFGYKHAMQNSVLEAVVFNSTTKNEIFYNTTIFHNDNLDGKTKRFGVELNSNLFYKDISIKNVASYINAKIDGGKFDSKIVPGVPSFKYSLMLGKEFNKKLRGNLLTNYVGKRYAISDVENKAGKLGGHSVTNLNLDYRYNKKLNLYFGINNLFNKKYSSYTVYYGSLFYYPSKERNYFLGSTYKF